MLSFPTNLSSWQNWSAALKNHVRDLKLEPAEKARLEKAAAILSSISNVTSLAALVRLVEREWDGDDLADALGISISALTPYLRKMYKAKLLRVRRTGRRTLYKCSNVSVVKAIREIELGPSDRQIRNGSIAGIVQKLQTFADPRFKVCP